MQISSLAGYVSRHSRISAIITKISRHGSNILLQLNNKCKVLSMQVQCSSFIMLCLGAIVMDHVIRESCYKVTILQKNIEK